MFTASQPRALPVVGVGGGSSKGGRDALPRRGPAAPQQPRETQGDSLTQVANAERQAIIDDLKKLQIGLEEEGGSPVWAHMVSAISARVSHALRNPPTKGGVEKRLERIEEILKKGAQNRDQQQGATTSYAAVAAGMRAAGTPRALEPKRHTVRIQMPQAKGLTNMQVLSEVRKTISEAAAIQVLRSGDIDVVVPTEGAKDRVRGIQSTENIKIFRQDYLVEVTSVRTTVPVDCTKGANNSRLAGDICEGSKRVSPGLQVSWMKWLHSVGEQAKSKRATANAQAKPRASLVMGFPTQEMQRRAIQGGIIIDAEWHETRPFERGLIATQCFQCQQWGHTSKACSKHVRCGKCAGSHQTNFCEKGSVSCANCGGSHRTWVRSACPAFREYFKGIQERRVALYTQASRLSIATPVAATEAGGWTQVPRKRRGRSASPSQGDTQRRIGRPTDMERAGRMAGQKTINFVFGAGNLPAIATPLGDAGEEQAPPIRSEQVGGIPPTQERDTTMEQDG